MGKRTFRIYRGDHDQGSLNTFETEVSEGMVVLDVIHKIQAEQANDRSKTRHRRTAASGSAKSWIWACAPSIPF